MIEKLCLVAVMAVFCAGCASTACNQDLAYQQATLESPLKAPAGLTIPQPGSTYLIPQVKDGGQSFLYKVPDANNPDEKVTRCLALPPPLPENGGGKLPSKPPKPSV